MVVVVYNFNKYIVVVVIISSYLVLNFKDSNIMVIVVGIDFNFSNFIMDYF